MNNSVTTPCPAPRPGFGRRLGLVALLLVFFGGPLFHTPLLAREYSMFDKVNGAELVIVGRVLKARTKAEIEVEQVLKGEWTRKGLEIRFRGENYERQKIGIDKIQFYEGERLLLFLQAPDDKARSKGRFILYPEDSRGRLELHDDEEARLILGTVQACVEASYGDRDELREVWRQMSREQNVYLRLCGLESLEYDRALGIDDLPLLAALYNDRYPLIRGRALRLTASVARYRPGGFHGTAEREILRDEVLPLLEDDHEAVRLEAVRTMQYLGDRNVLPLLQKISRSDTSQEVRLEASRVIFQQEADWMSVGGAGDEGQQSGEGDGN
jgi:hypothetical protein